MADRIPHQKRFYGSRSMDEKPQAPVQWEAHGRRSVPEVIARQAYEEYAAAGHGSQSFERLHQRGGFGVVELLMLLSDRIHRLESTAPSASSPSPLNPDTGGPQT